MPKDTKTLGNNKALACESRGFVHEKEVCFSTHLLLIRKPREVFSSLFRLSFFDNVDKCCTDYQHDASCDKHIDFGRQATFGGK